MINITYDSFVKLRILGEVPYPVTVQPPTHLLLVSRADSRNLVSTRLHVPLSSIIMKLPIRCTAAFLIHGFVKKQAHVMLPDLTS